MQKNNTATQPALSDAEIYALQCLKSGDSCISLDSAPSKTISTDIYTKVGVSVWRRLIKRRFVISPEEDPVDMKDGTTFTFTSFLEITDEGIDALRIATGY